MNGMMKNKILSIAVLLVISIPAGKAGARAEIEGGWLPEKPQELPDISLSNSFMTKYMWRGWNLGDEPVWQMDASLSMGGLTFGLWTNYSLNDEKTRDGGRYQEYTEVDYSVDYTFNVGEMSGLLDIDSPDTLDPLSISAGYIYYTFPNVDRDDKFFDSHEVYLGCSYDCFLQPSFTWYWDVGSGKGNSDGGGAGSYFLFGIGHTFDLGESGISATAGMTAGVIDEQWTDRTGWADMVFSGEVRIPVANYFTVTPNIAYSVILDRETYDNAAANEFYGGITFGFEY